MGERLSAEDREAALATWFTENLTWEHFRDWGDEEWARNLLAEVERLVAAAVAEERERIAAEIEALPFNEGYNTRAQAGYVTAQYDAARIARGDL